MPKLSTIAALRRLVTGSPRLLGSLSLLAEMPGGVLRLLAAVLITVAACSDHHAVHGDQTWQVRAAAMSPFTATTDLLPPAAATVDVVDDGIDIHLASRGQAVASGSMPAPPVAKPYAKPLAQAGMWLPERPPRAA